MSDDKTLTNSTLTPKMLSVLEAAMEIGLNRSITKVCDDADVARQTFYKWLDSSEEFKKAWDEVWYGSIKRHLPGVISAQIERALQGDTRAAELIAKLAGVSVEKLELSGAVDVGAKVTYYLPEKDVIDE